MLTRMYVDNYKCLVNFEFRPSRKQLVIGTNGSGKSTALDVLSLLRDVSIDGRMDGLGGKTRTRWRPSAHPQRFELDVSGKKNEYRYVLLVDDFLHPRAPRILEESIECNGKKLFHFEKRKLFLHDEKAKKEISFPGFPGDRSALSIGFGTENAKLEWFRRWLQGITHVQINPWAMSARSESETKRPTKNLSNFADWYRHLLLDSSSRVLGAVSALQDALPGLESLDIKEAGLDVRVVTAGMQLTKGEKPEQFVLDDLSDGQRTLIALHVLLQFAVTPDSILMIDEPDNFIALAEIQPWLMKLLDRVDEQNGQVILVSHHPELLNQLAARGGVIFDRPNGLHTRVREFDPKDDSGLTPAEIVARGWEHA